jgi:hypothetical protein
MKMLLLNLFPSIVLIQLALNYPCKHAIPGWIFLAKSVPDLRHIRLLTPAALASGILVCGKMREAHFSANQYTFPARRSRTWDG